MVIRTLLAALALALAAPVHAAATLCYLYENSLTISQDANGTSDGGTTVTAASGAAFSTSNPRSGTYSALYNDDFGTHSLPSASIFNAAEGSMAFSIYVTTWVDTVMIGGFVDVDNIGDYQFAARLLGTSGSGNLRFRIVNVFDSVNIDTSGLNLAVNTMYGVVFRWHAANADARLEVYNSSGTLLGSAQNLSVSFTMPSTEIDFAFTGRLEGDGVLHADTWLVGDTYAEALEDDLDTADCTALGGGGGSATPAAMHLQRLMNSN
jgi:hypothetical protein